MIINSYLYFLAALLDFAIYTNYFISTCNIYWKCNVSVHNKRYSKNETNMAANDDYSYNELQFKPLILYYYKKEIDYENYRKQNTFGNIKY